MTKAKEGLILLQRDEVVRAIAVGEGTGRLRSGNRVEGIALEINKNQQVNITYLTDQEALWLAHTLIRTVNERQGGK